MGTIWQLIAAEMNTRKMTKADLARIAGVSPSAVQKWEQGGRISLEPGIRMARELGIEIDRIRPGSEDPAAWHARAGMQAGREMTSDYNACRIPESCDLPARLKAMEDDCQSMHDDVTAMRAQLDTLTRLLGASLRSTREAPDAGKKAG
jgi:transcriptional regulator with XRE-family HTH domain